MSTRAVSYKNRRFPSQIIARAVWPLYFLFPLSLRLVEEILPGRGIVVSYETICRWGQKFGPAHARQLRRKKPSHHEINNIGQMKTYKNDASGLAHAVSRTGCIC